MERYIIDSQNFSFSRDSWNEPERVKGLDKVRVCAAFASGVISAVIGDDGSLWVWGRSKRGQLGLGKGIVEAIVPSRVEALAGEKIAKVGFLFLQTSWFIICMSSCGKHC
jgi:hypothetical protein